MMRTIRKARIKDARQVYSLAKEMPRYEGIDRYFQWLERYWLIKYILLGKVLVHSLYGNVYGFLAHRKNKIEMIVVHKEYRKRDIGRSLVFNFVKSNNYRTILIKSLPESIDFWWQIGFEFKGNIPMKLEVK